ncbi:DUF1857-domain-containing protein [Pterulicium gracile]|uniref:DUF1857-domain-containing protein n=1 Tax=Pterulicium gracile TaxID=1884261 RepID=A0A5C3QNA3_9AGAR|nr:DUF1857-domain-containing protein [Pterula gracilis]
MSTPLSSTSKPGPSISASRLVNPPNEETKITLEQLWKGLERKVREPQLFVAAFESCEILSDDGHKVRIGFPGPGGPIHETCYIYPNSMIYFEGDPIRVTNGVSYNESGELLLTYAFSNGIPGPFPREGLLEGETLQKAIQSSGGAVEGTLKQIRKMVKEGEL